MNLRLRSLFVVAVVGVGAVAAHAQSTASFYNGGGTQSTFGNATGWAFQVTTAVNVVELGYYDHGDPGFADRHTVGIFEVSNPGVALVETTLPAGTVAPLTDGSRFQSVTSTLLSAGVSYYILADNNGTDQFAYGSGAVTYAPEVTWLNYTDGVSNDIHDGVNQNSGLPGNLGPNFRFTPVPEPASICAIAAGLGLLARRRKRA